MPLLARIVIGLVVAYALSPIDLIPDFIPIIGYLDDLLLLPLSIWLVVRLIPQPVWIECQAQVARRSFEMPRSIRAAVVIVVIWVLVSTCLALYVLHLVGIIGSGI